jgi:hypothetical protein
MFIAISDIYMVQASLFSIIATQSPYVAIKNILMKTIDIKLSRYRESLLKERFQALKKDQSLIFGLLGGFITALLCALVWFIIIMISGYQSIGMALFIGFMVGSAIKTSGLAIDKKFRILGALFSSFSCLLGNTLSTLSVIGESQDKDFFTVVLWINFNSIGEVVPSLFSSYHMVIYLLAAISGYYFSATNNRLFYNYRHKNWVK